MTNTSTYFDGPGIIVGLDASTANTGWCVLAASGGFYRMAGYGSFKPQRIAQKLSFKLRSEITAQDRVWANWRAVHDLDHFLRWLTAHCNGAIAGIEQVTFAMHSLQSMATGVGSYTAASAALWGAYTVGEVFPIVPTAWQSLIRTEGLDSKQSSELLAKSVYDVQDADEDSCDAIAIAHYTAHWRGRMRFIDAEVHRTELGIPADTLFELGRQRIFDARGELLNAKRLTEKLTRRYDIERGNYISALIRHRKEAGLPPKSKAKPDGNQLAPAMDGLEIDMDKLRERMAAYKDLFS